MNVKLRDEIEIRGPLSLKNNNLRFALKMSTHNLVIGGTKEFGQQISNSRPEMGESVTTVSLSKTGCEKHQALCGPGMFSHLQWNIRESCDLNKL